MRAMWSAASGMKSLQLNVDTIAHNLSNVNTTGYKKQRTEFKDLLYVKLRNNPRVDGVGAPASMQVGHGVIPGANVRGFSQGAFKRTDATLDFGIEGEGFFEVMDAAGNALYTRDGSFKLAINEGGSYSVTTSEGYYVQSLEGNITFDGPIKELKVNPDGSILYRGMESKEGEFEQVGTMKLVKVANPQGMNSKGMNFYSTTGASGEAIVMENGEAGIIRQGVLEMSNVQVVDEMVNLITAQRAYEINSKAIQTADQMLELANNLKR